MDPYLQELKDKAKQLKAEGKLAMFSSSDKHAAYKEQGEDQIHVRYVCSCGHKEELCKEYKGKPLQKCTQCKEIVWESKLRKSKANKKSVSI